MTKHIARMMEGDAFSTAVVKTDVFIAVTALAVAVATHLA